MPKQVLFLDLARVTGWALGRPGHGLSASGSIELAPAGAAHGAMLNSLHVFCDRMIEDHAVEVIAIEEPLDPRYMGKRTNSDTIKLLNKFPGIVERVAFIHRLPDVYECHVQTIRKTVLQRAPRKKDPKGEVHAHLFELGYRPQDDNEADAIAGWLYVAAVKAPGSEAISPLELRGMI